MFRMRKVAVTELPSIAAALRPIDAAEVLVGGYTPLTFLHMAHAECEVFYVMEHHIHGVVAVGGVMKEADASCIKTAWLLNTVAVEKCKIEYLRESRFLWEFGFKEASTERVGNYVWKDNLEHIKWLKWCGAEFDSETYILDGAHYRYFVIEKGRLKCG